MLQALATLAELFKRLGVRLSGIVMMILGLGAVLSYRFEPRIVIGGAVFCAGLAIVAFGKKFSDATTLYVANEAEKRIISTAMPPCSTLKPIAREIAKQQGEEPPK